jgi:hypothetical protein
MTTFEINIPNTKRDFDFVCIIKEHDLRNGDKNIPHVNAINNQVLPKKVDMRKPYAISVR